MTRDTEKAPPKRYVETIRLVVSVVILTFTIKITTAEAYRIEQSSMEQTLMPGDVVIGVKFIYGGRLPFINVRLPGFRHPRPGDIVVVNSPIEKGVKIVKRVIAIEGQTIEIRNKQLFVDDELVPRPEYARPQGTEILPRSQTGRDNLGPLEIPEGKLFLMGDNWDASYDSRNWGFLDDELVLAKAFSVLYTWQHEPTRPFWTALRFGRTFRVLH
ncbi:signal peptidase I [Candidatus Zixiibacteriota bacterium]